RAQETERRHIARELHDEIGQGLTAAQISLQRVRQRCTPSALATSLDESVELIGHILDQVRDLSLDLRPAVLDDLGLIAAWRWYLNRRAGRVGLEFQVRGEPFAERLPSDVETACFRVVQEALTNVVRHAQARRVVVELQRSATEVQLRIGDDGKGFNVQAA